MSFNEQFFLRVCSYLNSLDEQGEASGDYPPAIHDADTVEFVWAPPP
jgi:hypothetical protein